MPKKNVDLQEAYVVLKTLTLSNENNRLAHAGEIVSLAHLTPEARAKHVADGNVRSATAEDVAKADTPNKGE